MYILWIILGIVGLLFLGLLIFILTRPNEFRVVRDIFIKAPPEVAFQHVNNLKTWDSWSPWAKLDPNMKMTYGQKHEGPGATYQWTGNNKVGEGKLSILDARSPDSVKMKLEFIRPFKCQNDVDFTFERQGDGTKVIWGMDGKNNFMSKAMCLFMNMDKMVGKDFEKGLASLKSLSEAKS